MTDARQASGSARGRARASDVERSSRLYLAPWRIDLTVRAGALEVGSSPGLAKAMAAALAAGGAPGPASIGLILSDDGELAELNLAHLGHDGPTDVLSFPLLPPEAFPPHEGSPAPARSPIGPSFQLPPGRRLHLGDVIVSVERAVGQAELGRGGQTGDVRWSAEDELRLLVAHGTLHICGWDHADRAEEAAMRQLESSILASLRPAARRRGSVSPRL